MPVVIVGNQPGVILYDSNGVELNVQNGVATPVGTSGIIIAGSDGTNSRFIRTAGDGTVRVDPTGSTTQPVSGSVTANQGTAIALSGAWPVKVTDGTNVLGTGANPVRTDPTGTTTQPVSAASLPLPTGAATSANQTALGSQTTKVNDGTNTAAVKAASTAAVATDPALVVTISPNNTPVLPSGAATSANQTNATQKTQVVDGSGNVAPAGDTAARAGFEKITDGTNTAAVKAASTAAVATDPAIVVAISPNNTPVLPSGAATSSNQTNASQKTQVVDGSGNVHPSEDVAARAGFVKVTDGTNTQPTGDVAARKIFVQPTDGTNLQAMFDVLTRAGFVKLTDGTNNVAVKAASTAAVAADPALVVSVSPNTAITVGISQQDISSSGALGALNNAVSIVCAGTAGVGMQLSAGTLIGTIVPEISTDGGTTWNAGYFFDQISGVMSTSIVFSSSNTAQVKALIIVGGVSNVRVRVSAYTSGTANCAVRATTSNDPSTAIRGTDGTNLRTVLLDASGRIIIAPSGSNTTNGFAYGEITTTAVTNVAVRKTTYTEQASNAQRSVSSANANDTSAGTGARTIKITYYNSTGAGPSTETITMNGTTAVATVSTTICYIEKIEVLTVGSNGSNVGIISLFVNNSGGGGTIGTIAAGDNRTFWAHHYVPTGKTCSITSYTGNNNNGSNQTVFMIKAKDLSIAAAPEQQVSDTLIDGGAVSQTSRIFGVPISVAGPARVTLFGAPGGTPSIINRASFDFYEQ